MSAPETTRMASPANEALDDVVEVRATGRTPEAVSAEIQSLLAARNAGGWRLTQVQPIIYNSSTTGYLLLFFARGGRPAP